jgi:hypothetical protein
MPQRRKLTLGDLEPVVLEAQVPPKSSATPAQPSTSTQVSAEQPARQELPPHVTERPVSFQVRVPWRIHRKLVDIAHERSQRLGRRVTLTELVIEASEILKP